jgi:AcrR family transcriptional regulator
MKSLSPDPGGVPGAQDGLRSRKRAALQASIERSAIDLALEHGYDNVTVDMICQASMVSQRTFFNYFGSKEGVVLGRTPPMPSDDEVDAFVHQAGSNVLGDFVAMITNVLVDNEPDPALFRARRALIMGTPELLTKETARMGELEEHFVRVILGRFEAEGRSAVDEPDLEDEARMVVALTSGVLHYALRKWSSTEDTSESGSTRELLQGSIALIRRITGNEQHNIRAKRRGPAR